MALVASGAGLALAAAACALPSAAWATLPSFKEPLNALSLPTWAIHVSSVVEWYVGFEPSLRFFPFLDSFFYPMLSFYEFVFLFLMVV